MKKQDQVIQYVKMKNTLNTNKRYIYELTHTWDEQLSPVYIESNIDPHTMNLLIAYIQFECADIKETYGMSQGEVTAILEKFYGCKQVERGQVTNVVEIDIYINWETWCGYDVQNIDLFAKEGLKFALENMILDEKII